MQIIWYGNSCFLIKTSSGKRILLDPFEIDINSNTSFPKCDLITFSHTYFNRSYINKNNTDTKIINTEGYFDMNFVKIYGLNTYHDKLFGLKRGENIIFILKVENYTFCHLGGLGHIPDDNILDKLQGIDVLFVPIGGKFTLDGYEASKLCELILPKYIIPMQYKTLNSSIPLDDLEKFIFYNKYIHKFNSLSLDSNILTSKYQCNIVLMDICKLN
jgi:L-ascorbate metabolism protein UlaG (beta-lactamase superfamily)